MAQRGYTIEGWLVTWSENIGSGAAGWCCPCWKSGGLVMGPKNSCVHTQYVEQCELHQRPVEESGVKVVQLRRRS